MNRYLITGIFFVGFTFGMVACRQAHAEVRAEAGFGRCHAATPDDGAWHQRDLPHQLQLSDNCGEIGALWSIPNSNWSFGARFVNFGQYATYAIANLDPDDLQAKRGTKSQDHNRPECQKQGTENKNHPMIEDCYYRWNGTGHLWGGLLNVAWHPIRIGDLKLGGELGWVIYKATWRVIVQPTQNNDWQYQYDQRTGWNKSPEFGVSGYYKYAYAAYRIYMIPDGAPITPGYRSPVRQFVLGVSVPF